MDADIYRFEDGRATEVVASSMWEMSPDFSPDGRRIAFASSRSDEGSEIWLAAADGSNPERLTRGPGFDQESPSWSPDGRRVAFESWGRDSHADIWTAEVGGGAVRQLTRDPGDDNAPSWSRDGRFVYFTSDRTGAPEIWRIDVTTGSEERMTQHGAAFGAAESLDGRSLLFKRSGAPSPLLSLTLDGRKERTLVECTHGFFAVHATGIYYRGCEDGFFSPLHVIDPATGRDRILGKMDKDMFFRPAVSPDGKSILYTRDRGDCDLMMIENFR
jgi:Tol biopolymer transport system component